MDVSTNTNLREEAARRVNLEELRATMQSSMAAIGFDPSVLRKETRIDDEPSSMSFESLGVNEAMESNVPSINASNHSGSSELNSFSSFPKGDNVTVNHEIQV
uniref:Uncharacterized protein n=1 Tax=Tanacetum cinerariifolium TaxID=118510 RepID=A0A699IJN2_TANCI|nr:hypothetical protein [Tanacetum cinerariifolium]